MVKNVQESLYFINKRDLWVSVDDLFVNKWW